MTHDDSFGESTVSPPNYPKMSAALLRRHWTCVGWEAILQGPLAMLRSLPVRTALPVLSASPLAAVFQGQQAPQDNQAPQDDQAQQAI